MSTTPTVEKLPVNAQRATKPVRWLVRFIRLIAICQLLAIGTLFLPIEVWLSSWYSWLRLGSPPEVSAVLQYLLGGAAYFQGAIGVWMWMMISDLPRYRPLLFATGWIYLVAAPAFYLVDANAGLPLWWRWYDTIWCFLVGLAFFALGRCSPKEEAKPSVLPPNEDAA
jgi:hypothetical protein